MGPSTDKQRLAVGEAGSRARSVAWPAVVALALIALVAAIGCGAGESANGKPGKGSKSAAPADPVPAKDRRAPGFPSVPQRRSRAEIKRDAGLATKAKAGDEHPNFLHILTDDQTIDSLRYMKRVNRLLRRQGTTFSQYHDVQPLCCPSRASFLSGQYPHNHGVLSNKPPMGGFGAMDFNNTLYTALDDAGYDTGWIGKVLNVAPGTGLGVEPEPGFDDWYAQLIQPEDQMTTYEMSDNGKIESTTNGRYQNDLFRDRAHRFLDRAQGKPFLLTLAVFTPHWSPCEGKTKRRECPPPPAERDRGSFSDSRFPAGPNFQPGDDERFIERYWRRELEALQSVDRIVGGLVKQLRDQGELDNTYIIFQSDNGYLHYEHRLFGKNYPWDRSVRVPLVIRGPGFAAGENRADLTANVDLPATILDAAHVDPQRTLDGYSLLSGHQRSSLLMERQEGKSGGGIQEMTWRELKTNRGYTYWQYGDDGPERLYDLRRDPYQLQNLVRKKPGLADRLQRKIGRIKDCVGNCP